MKLRSLAAALCTGTLLALPAVSAHALDKLTLDVARKMEAACLAKSKEMGWKMNIAVVDSGANLVSFSRMDGAFLGSIDLAQRKAESSAKFPFSTRFLEELAYGKDKKGGPLPGAAQIPGIVTFAGGLPVMSGNVHLGGIGVSGGTADEDEICAKAGLDAVKDLLK